MWFNVKPQLQGLCFMWHDPWNILRTLSTGHTTLINDKVMFFVLFVSLWWQRILHFNTVITSLSDHMELCVSEMFYQYFINILIHAVLCFKPYLANNYGQIFCWCTLKSCPKTHVAWNHKKLCSKTRPQSQCKMYKHNLPCETWSGASHSYSTTDNKNIVLLWSTALRLSGINAWIMKCTMRPPLHQSSSGLNILSTYSDTEKLTCLGQTPRWSEWC